MKVIIKDDIKKWVSALRSGKFKQTKLTLQDSKGYCCLGVACEVLIPTRKQWRKKGRLVGGTPRAQRASPEWLKEINTDFYVRTKLPLVGLNDSGKFNFDEIADLLEAVYILEVLKPTKQGAKRQ